MLSFDNLLEFGHNNLKKFSDGQLLEDDNVTGIEPHLKGDYLKQIVEINKYIFTTASANHPQEYFQNLFIEGFVDRNTMNIIYKNINVLNCHYIFKKLDDSVYVADFKNYINNINNKCIRDFYQDDMIEIINSDIEYPDKYERGYIYHIFIISDYIEDRDLYKNILNILRN